MMLQQFNTAVAIQKNVESVKLVMSSILRELKWEVPNYGAKSAGALPQVF